MRRTLLPFLSMGDLTVNAGVFNFRADQADNTIALNFRYPKGTDPETIKAQLEQLATVEKVTLSAHGHTPHYTPL